MYFPNYYNPGPLNWIRVATLFIIMVPLIIYEFADSYFKTNDDKRKRLIKYFTLMVVFGYAFGGIPNFLVYGIHIDPFWGMFTSVFIFAPFLYGAYNYELFDIRFIAKQAFLYGLTIVVAGGVIMLVEYANRYISTINPNFPSWVSPFISGIVFTIIATSVWRQLKKTDLLRYEFITIVTHKFRTPLTHIKWASENLMKNNLNEDCKTQLAYIQTAETKLSQLTDLLARVSSLDSDKSDYEFKKTNISELIFDILDSLNKQGISVDSKLMTHVEPNLFARCDYIRFRFALQVLIENAISYSPKGSPIEIRLEKNNDGNIVYIVKDQGIGIDKKDFNLLFTKFYRTERAQTMDTEGMGIGLYMTKVIVENHKGTITVSSEGQDKGSTFTVSVPGYE
jgi:signal transduction histidine kinase